MFQDTLATVHNVPVSEVYIFAPKVPNPMLIMNEFKHFTQMNIQTVSDKVNEIKSKVQSQYKELMSTQVMLTLATVLAIIVGVVSYAYRAARVWYTNGGKEVIVANTIKVLQFVIQTAESLETRLSVPVDQTVPSDPQVA